ncbi:MAG: Rrf2 family transcriptional regulator, partial [Magnetococcales bacterium]|nr:Rrf2 family transcriptional regulator [Magnetococcales bacterium]
SRPKHWHSASEIAKNVDLPAPTVIKVLKILTKGKLLESRRGATGGYRLIDEPSTITLENIITALEGPLALVACVKDHTECTLTTTCQLSDLWQKVNQSIRWTLSGITLEEMVNQPSQLSQPPPNIEEPVT